MICPFLFCFFSLSEAVKGSSLLAPWADLCYMGGPNDIHSCFLL